MNIVKELRKRKGVQQKELAIEIGVTQPTISDWETGRKDPSGERLTKLAQYFDVDPLVILGKGVIDLTKPQEHTQIPRTPEARIVSGAMDKLPQEQREQILAVIRAMFARHPEIFEEGSQE